MAGSSKWSWVKDPIASSLCPPPLPGSIFYQLLALFLYRTCHCSPHAKLVHGSALFPWTRSPLLSPLSCPEALWIRTISRIGVYCCLCLAKCDLPGTENCWLELCNDAFPPEALSRWDAQHVNCRLEWGQESLLQGLQHRILGPDLASTKTLKPPNFTGFFKPVVLVQIRWQVGIWHRKGIFSCNKQVLNS